MSLTCPAGASFLGMRATRQRAGGWRRLLARFLPAYFLLAASVPGSVAWAPSHTGVCRASGSAFAAVQAGSGQTGRDWVEAVLNQWSGAPATPVPYWRALAGHLAIVVLLLATAYVWHRAVARRIVAVMADLEAKNRELRHQQEETRLSEARFRLIFENAPDAIAISRLDDGVLLDANPVLLENCGFASIGEARATGFRVYAALADGVDEAVLGEIREKGLVRDREARFLRPDGTARDIIYSSVLLPAEEGDQALSVVVDVTEKVMALNALRESEARYRELVENVNSVILRMDCEGKILFINEFAQRFFGYGAEDVVGRNVVGTIVPETDSSGEDLRAMIASIGRCPERYVGNENENMRRDGSRVWLSWTNRPLHDAEGGVKELLCVANDITARRQAEAVRQESEARFRELAVFFPETIYECDTKGRITWANVAAHQAFGYSDAELARGLRAVDLLVPRDRERGHQSILRLLDGNPSDPAEYTAMRKDGTRFEVLVYSAVRYQDGEPAGLNGVVIDISQRVRMERAILESGKRARRQRSAIVSLALEKEVAGLDLSAAMQRVTAIVAATVGVARAGVWVLSDDATELRCLSLYEAGPAQHSSGAVLKTADYPRYLGAIRAESRVWASDAWTDPRTSELSAGYLVPLGITSMLDAGVQVEGELVGLVCLEHIGEPRQWQPDEESFASTVAAIVAQTVVSIRRREAEEALKESEERFRRLVENAPFGLSLMRPDQRFILLNQRFAGIFGYTMDDIPDKEAWLARAYPASDYREQVAATWAEDLGQGEQGCAPEVQESVVRCKDGQDRTIHSHAVVLQDGSQITSYEDITERERAAADRETLREQLLQAQKLESVGRLAGGVAHDFNNMLHAILGYTELALAEAAPEGPLQAHLREIQKAAEHSAHLTRQLLAFARKQTVSPRVLALNETVTEMLSMLGRLVGENIRVAWVPGARLWPVKMDPTQVGMVLANLCANARDAITETGRITIESQNVDIDEAYCATHANVSVGEYVMLAVSDDGRGMDPGTLSEVFEPFFTTKDVGEGTGLGLATVHGIALQNDGFVNVYSEVSEGTTFRFYVPRHREDGGQAESSSVEQAPVVRGGQEAILVVEDEPAILAVCGEGLRRLGYRTLLASTPGEALRLARSREGRIDLLITDVVMPEMNGRTLAAQIAELLPGIPCIHMSGYPANAIARHGILEEGLYFLQKPFNANTLAAKVREALDAAQPGG